MRCGQSFTAGLATFLVVVTAGAAEEPLGYAGFALTTTLAEASARYPSSRAQDSVIEVADSDSESDGHIAYVSVREDFVGVGFGRRKIDGPQTFPTCMEVFDQLFAKYGGPNIVQQSYEAATKVHRRVWVRGAERLALRCFDRNGERYAERVEIYRYPNGAI